MLKLLKSSLFAVILSNISNFLAYILFIILARLMNVEDFGVFGAFNSLFMIFGGVTTVISYIVSKVIIENENDNGAQALFLFKIIKGICIFFFASLFFVTMGKGEIKHFLKIDDDASIYIFAVICLFSLILYVFLGVLLGKNKYIPYTMAGLYMTIVRVIFTLFFVYIFKLSYNGALLGILVAHLVVSSWVVYFVYIEFYKDKLPIDFKKLGKGSHKNIAFFGLNVGLNYVLIAYNANIDVLLIKHYFSDVLAGKYVAISSLAKIASYFPAILLNFVFSHTLKNGRSKERENHYLYVILIITSMFSGLFLIIMKYFAYHIVYFLYGENYVGNDRLLVFLTLSMVVISVINVLFNYLLAKEKYLYLIIVFVINILAVSYISLTLPGIEDIVKILMYSNFISLATVVSYMIFEKRNEYRKIS